MGTLDPLWAEFEQDGESTIRQRVTQGLYSGQRLRIAKSWLESKDQERAAELDRLSAASQAEQIVIARSAKDAAWVAAKAAERAAVEAKKANTRATIALALAAISVIISAVVAVIGVVGKHPS